jgi:hypothetical protein
LDWTEILTVIILNTLTTNVFVSILQLYFFSSPDVLFSWRVLPT